MKNWLPFEEAREVVRKEGIKDRKEYQIFRRKNSLNLPSCPEEIYVGKWISWYDWFGKDENKFLTFEDARKAVRKVGIGSGEEYHLLIKDKSLLLPYSPNTVYRNKWVSWYDWLGKDRNIFLKFNEAREAVIKVAKLCGVNSFRKWRQSKKYGYNRPSNIPSDPSIIYKNRGWISWQHWFNTNNISGQLRKYSVNDSFFKKWSPNMAYILGFWWADGCILKIGNRYVFSICQLASGKYILRDILDSMNSNNPLHRRKRKGCHKESSSFNISSKEIVEDIIKLGGQYNKSLTIGFPKSIPKKYSQKVFTGFYKGIF